MSTIMQKLLLGAVALGFAAGGFWLANRPGNEPAGNAGSAAQNPAEALFAAQLPDKSGQMQALAKWRGKPLIVNFWASWCGPCVREMPELMALASELAPKGIQTIGIGVDSAANISEFAAKHQISYPLLEAGVNGTELSHQLGNETGGLPFTVLIDKNGKIKKTYLGTLEFKQLRLDIAQEFK